MPFFIPLIILFILTAALFPADLFLFEVGEPVIWCFVCAAAVLAGLVLTRRRSRIATKIISVFLALASAAASFCGIYLDPYFNTTAFRVTAPEATREYDTLLSVSEANSDLDYAVHFLVKDHPALTEGLTPELSHRLTEVRSEISAKNGVTVNELAQLTESVFSLLGDAHTVVYRSYAEPLYLREYYRFKTNGYKLTAINGRTIDELLTEKASLYSFEAESWELKQLKNDLLSVQGLAYLGISVSDGVEMTFENESGTVSETFHSEDFVTYSEYLRYNNIAAPDGASDAEKSFVSFVMDEENSLAVLTLDECTYNSEYIECVRSMFSEVKEKGIRNVAVDLRRNGGGSDQVAEEFIRYLDTDSYRIASATQRLGFLWSEQSPFIAENEKYDDLLFGGNVYILTSSGTFSSAMLFSQYIKDNSLGTVIGEPPGNDPNGFGEITRFRMPHSGIMFCVSTKKFIRADKNCPDKYVMPDISCPAELAPDTLYSLILP